MSSEGVGKRFERTSTLVNALIAIVALIVAITEVRALRAMQRHDKMEALYA